MTNKVKFKKNKATVYSTEDYRITEKKLLMVKDNGNGFTVKSYGWSSLQPDMYWNIPYDVAVDLMAAFNKMGVSENY